MVIAATGHRPHKLNNEYDGVGPHSDYLREEFHKVLTHYSPRKIISGMALGVDMLWAETALQRGISVIAAIPFVGQESRWPQSSADRYRKILLHPLCSYKIISSGGYSPKKMQIRNEWMVDNCDLLVAVWDGSPGGTANCVNYAPAEKIIRILPLTSKYGV